MESYHLWRQYPEAPYHRFACTVVFDENAEDGYRVVDFDPVVADANFLHRFAEHMQKSAPEQKSTREGESVTEWIEWERPGTYDHFCAAIRQFSLAKLSSKGRPT